jgi:ribosomal protein S18 acetylase RimI-like enzyme
VDLLPLNLTDRSGRPFEVRRFLPEDRSALHAMYADFEPKRGAQGLPPRLEGISGWLDLVLARGEHLLVCAAGEVRGHLMLLPMGGGQVELANFLHQAIRGRGVGTAINRIALDVARQSGHSAVWLCVEPTNIAAVRSYEKAGFRRLPGTLWSAEIEMQAELTPAGMPPEPAGE